MIAEAKENANIEAQKLIFKGKQLANECTIESYNIKDGDSAVLFINKKLIKKVEEPVPQQPAPTQNTEP